MRTLVQLTLIFLLVDLNLANSQLQCRDEQNNTVDWYVIYKIPKMKSNANKLIEDGLAYAYITSARASQGWTLSRLSVGDPTSMPGRTLQHLYDRSQSPSTLWMLYNDQPPGGVVNDELGHTKGVVMTGTDGGFWLVHSVPHFPPPPTNTSSNYSYPHTGQHYGQSFLCISFVAKQMDQVGVQLTFNEPLIYASNAPHSFENLLPHLCAAANNTRVSVAPWYNTVPLTSRAGQTFQSFAKSSQFNKDLYADWVAAALQVNLLVESWLNGRGKLTSDCKHQYTVENVATISVRAARANFTTHVDHSKWAAAEDKIRPWVCIGDINREAGQLVRGGGTVCLKHAQLWTAYRTAVLDVEPCPAKITATNVILN